MSDLISIHIPGTTSAIQAALIDGRPFVALKPMCEALGAQWRMTERYS